MSPLFAIHLFLYFIEVCILALVAAFPSESGRPYRKGICFGLLASPLGLVLPYLTSILLAGLLQSLGGNIFGQVITVIPTMLFLVGPVVGPPLVVAVIAIHYRRQSRT